MRELNLHEQQQWSLVGIRFASENGAREPTWMKDECAEEVGNGVWLSPHPNNVLGLVLM